MSSQQLHILFLFFLSTQLSFSQNNRIDSLKNVISNATADTVKIDALDDLAWEYLNNKADTAFILATEAYELAKKNQDKTRMADMYSTLGSLKSHTGEFKESLLYYNQALNIWSIQNDKEGVAIANGNIGIVYQEMGEYKKAVPFLELSVKQCQEVNDKEGIGNAYHALGSIYDEQNKYVSALEYYLKAVRFYEELTDDDGRAGVYNSIGVIYNKTNQLPKALNYFLMAEKIFIKENNQRGLQVCYNNIAIYYENVNDYRSSTDYYNKSLIISENLSDTLGIADVYYNIGGNYSSTADTILEIESSTNEYQKSIEYLFKSLKLYESLGIQNLIGMCCNQIAATYIGLGLPQKALEFLNRSLLIENNYKTPEGFCYIYWNFSLVYEKLLDLDKAKQYAKLSKKYCKQLERAMGKVKK